MVEPKFPEGKEQVMLAFGKLLAQYQTVESKVATKEEEAEKAKNQQLLTRATDYTVDNIVNGMASLQLDFGGAIDQIKDKLAVESTKLDEFKKAISVAKDHLQQLSQVRLVADALHILQQEHHEKLRRLAQENQIQQVNIAQEKAKIRKLWQQEEADFLTAITEEDELIAQQREQEEADYRYELARQRQIEDDEYQEDKRQQARELAEIGQEKLQDWVKREQYLADNAADFTANQDKIAGFEEKIQAEYNQAKGEAIKEALDKAKVEVNLLEKEWESAQQGFIFQVESLQENINSKEEQIRELTTELQEANSQAQSLAMKAFSS